MLKSLFSALRHFTRNEAKHTGVKINLYFYRELNTSSPLTFRSKMSAPKKICIVGSGNWGSAISRLVGVNAAENPNKFVKDVNMWVFEEMIDGQKLTEIINTKHENVKYLPGRQLPENVIAVPNIVDAAADADLIIFVIPHQVKKLGVTKDFHYSLGTLQRWNFVV